MENYIRTILVDAQEDMIGSTRTPAAKYLFKINTVDPIKLSTARAGVFHHIIMQLMYLSQRARPDI